MKKCKLCRKEITTDDAYIKYPEIHGYTEKDDEHLSCYKRTLIQDIIAGVEDMYR